MVVHTDPQIVYENPFRDYAINDWCVGYASEIMSIDNAAFNDEPAAYSLGGRKDVVIYAEPCAASCPRASLTVMSIASPTTKKTRVDSSAAR